MPYDFIVWRQSWGDWLAGTSCWSRQNNIDLQVIFIELIELTAVCMDANVFPNLHSEFSPSAHFLASCWECFPLTKLNKFLSVNVQCNNCFQTQAKQSYVNKSYKLPNTTRVREDRVWN